MIRTLNEQDTDAFLALKRRGLTTDPDSFSDGEARSPWGRGT
jgi:hypothetical protein